MRDKLLNNLVRLPIFDDTDASRHIWGTTLSLSDQRNLTVYDTTCLALRLSLPLATLDRELRLAARAESVPLLGL